MNDIPLGALYAALAVCLLLSAFFSGSETGLMTLNRYRLKHLARSGHRGAQRAQRLLERPDRLIGIILLGNNFVNILASSLATIIALRLGGEGAIAAAAGLLTLVVLIFSEIAPKTLAALHPERVAFPASLVISPLLRLCYPMVWLANGIANLVLRPFGVSARNADPHALSQEELRTVVLEAGVMIPKRHQKMLLSILDLEAVTVDDIMVPRSEVVGIDLDEDWSDIRQQLTRSQYSKLPLYRGDLNNVIGFLHLRKVLNLTGKRGEVDRADLEAAAREPYYIPEGTPLNKQLLNFQQRRRRIGLVVDEYGEVLGLVTLEDILEEIVGEFTTDPGELGGDITRQPDGSYLIDASLSIRVLNRKLGWHLPTHGPKTLNGLVMEYLETIPESGVSVLLAGHPTEIVKSAGNRVLMVKMGEKLKRASRT